MLGYLKCIYRNFLTNHLSFGHMSLTTECILYTPNQAVTVGKAFKIRGVFERLYDRSCPKGFLKLTFISRTRVSIVHGGRQIYVIKSA